MTTENQNHSEHRHSHRRGRLGFFGLATLVGIGALVAATAYTPAAEAWGRRAAWGHHGRHGDISDAKVLKHVQKGADKLINRVDGTEAQRAALDPIIESTVPELLALRTEGKALKGEFHGAMMQDELDRDLLEGLRQQGLSLADRATGKLLDALVDVTNVLTPDQRADLQEDLRRMEKWRN